MKKQKCNAAGRIKFLLCVIMAVALLAVGVGSLLKADALVSVSEKRTLAEKPMLSVQNLLGGEYADAFERYYSDHFWQRDQLLAQNRKLNRFYYYSGAEQSVVVMAEHDNLAEGGESLKQPTKQTEPTQATTQPTQPTEASTELPTEATEPTEPPEESTYNSGVTDEDITVSDGSTIVIGDRAMELVTAADDVLSDYAANINRIKQAVGTDVRVFSLIAPNAAEFYSPEDMHTGIYSQKDMIAACYGQMDETVQTVDAYSVLQQHVQEEVYFRTDHHWTALGAYYAYTAFCQTAGLHPVQLQTMQTGSYGGFTGSLYLATSAYAQSEVLKENPDTVTYYEPTVRTKMSYYDDASLSDAHTDLQVICSLNEDVTNKYLCFLGGDHPITWIDTDVDNGRVCLVLKESYGNAFTPFLTHHYQTIIAIDPREFNRDGKPDLDLAAFVQEHGINDIIAINYPLAVNNSAIVRWMGRLVE